MSGPVSLRDLPLAARRERMSKWLDRLRSAYGESAGPAVSEPALDLLIREYLTDELGPRKAATACELLRREFVDWNEVRVSRDSEIQRVLAEVGLTKEQAQGIRNILSVLFERTNTLSLEHLRGRPLHEVAALLDSLGVSLRARHTAAFLALGANVLALEPAALRVLRRLEAVSASAGADQALEELASVVAAADRSDFYWLTSRHARETCKERRPLCSRCVLRADCPSGRARRARTSAAERKADESKTEKSQRKKGRKEGASGGA